MLRIFLVIIMYVTNSYGSYEYNNLCDDPKYQNICNNNMNISRINMPQLTKNTQNRYLTMKQSLTERFYVNPMELIPTQSEIDSVKVSKIIESFNIRGYNICSDQNLAILVARNNETNRMHIIDGHHRYAACYFLNQSINIDVINGSVYDILNELNSLYGIKI